MFTLHLDKSRGIVQKTLTLEGEDATFKLSDLKQIMSIFEPQFSHL